MTLVKDIVYLFSVFRKYVGARLYIIFLLTTLAAATEGIGIALLLPLITLTDIGDGNVEASTLSSILQDGLAFLGISESFVGILIFIGVVFTFKGMLKFAEGGYKHILQAQLLREIKSKMFDHYTGMDFGYYSRHNTGHFVNVINTQVNDLVLSFERYKVFVSSIITTSAYVIFALLINWKFASLAVVFGIIILVLFNRLNIYVRHLSRMTAKERSNLNKFLVQTMQSFKYIISTAQTPYFRKSIMRSVGKITKYIRSQGFADAFTKAIKEPISIILILGIIIIQITFLNAQLAPIFVALILIHRAMGHFVTIQSSWQHTMSKIGSLEMVENEFSNLTKSQSSNGLQRIGSFQDSIKLRNVSYSYSRRSKFALQNISLSIRANTTVAFVGESGAGKTTLVDMLTLLLQPDKGEILIDGVPASKIDSESWRKQIGYVPQDTVVFDDTIANNISMWKGDYESDPEIRKRIVRAAEKACARKFIEQLPLGFNTVVGDRGIRLSGGQRQRLFIARELFKEPRFLILDEATNALDSESEGYIKKSIDALKGSTTIVIISHRLSTIKHVDYIYVVDYGNIAEEGTYEELTSSNGTSFNRMVALQSL